MHLEPREGKFVTGSDPDRFGTVGYDGSVRYGIQIVVSISHCLHHLETLCHYFEHFNILALRCWMNNARFV